METPHRYGDLRRHNTADEHFLQSLAEIAEIFVRIAVGGTGFRIVTVLSRTTQESGNIVDKDIPTPGDVNEIKCTLILEDVKKSKDNLEDYIKIIKKN